MVPIVAVGNARGVDGSGRFVGSHLYLEIVVTPRSPFPVFPINRDFPLNRL